MSCSLSITPHLLRGVGAVALLTGGFFMATTHPLFLLAALAGSVMLLRGCPLCWGVELVKKIKHLSLLRKKKYCHHELLSVTRRFSTYRVAA